MIFIYVKKEKKIIIFSSCISHAGKEPNHNASYQ